MSSLEIGTDVTVERPTTEAEKKAAAERRRRAILRIGQQVAREHPHPLDDVMPRIAGAVIARDPKVRHELTELLDAVFGTKNPRRKP